MTVKEVEERTGLPRANIRYYESEGLIHPARGENGYRDYRQEDVDTLLKIKLLRQVGFSLEVIRALQAGELDLEPALEGRLAALTSQQTELGQAAGICRAMREDHVRYDTLDAPVYLDRMSQPERPSLTWREDPPPRAVFPWRRFWAGRSKTEWLPSKRFSPLWNSCLLCRRRPWCRLQLRRSLRTFLERCRSFPACRREGS